MPKRQRELFHSWEFFCAFSIAKTKGPMEETNVKSFRSKLQSETFRAIQCIYAKRESRCNHKVFKTFAVKLSEMKRVKYKYIVDYPEDMIVSSEAQYKKFCIYFPGLMNLSVVYVVLQKGRRKKHLRPKEAWRNQGGNCRILSLLFPKPRIIFFVALSNAF